MNNLKKITWGIVLALVGVAVVLLALFPEYGPVGVPAWKWIVGGLLIYWLLNRLIVGRGLREKLDIFWQLAFLFMVFESNIAELIGRDENFVNNWLILGAAIILSVAVKLIFPKTKSKDHNTLSSSVVYIDATEKKSRNVWNRFGEMNVFYQNTDEDESVDPLKINVTNKFGHLVIHVPIDWTVELKATNSFGELSARENTVGGGRTLIVDGSNSFGAVEVVSP